MGKRLKVPLNIGDERLRLNGGDRKLLLRVNRLLEEVLETLEVMDDDETVKAIRDLRAGRVRGYDEFVEELRRSGEI